MGYPKQPGQDADAHRRVVEKCLAQTKEIAALREELSRADQVASGLEQRASDAESDLARLRSALADAERQRDEAKEERLCVTSALDDHKQGLVGRLLNQRRSLGKLQHRLSLAAKVVEAARRHIQQFEVWEHCFDRKDAYDRSLDGIRAALADFAAAGQGGADGR